MRLATDASVADDHLTCWATPRQVAALIRRARERQGLTQHQLALRIESTQSTVARWEAGEHQFTMRTLQRIASALNVEMVVRFGADGEADSS